MKKSKLIELLNSIEGDPEVFIHDSGESGHVKIEEEIKVDYLARLSLQYWREMIEAELVRERYHYNNNRSLLTLTEEDKEKIEEDAVKAYADNPDRQSIRHPELSPSERLFDKWYDDDYEKIIVLYPVLLKNSYFKASDK